MIPLHEVPYGCAALHANNADGFEGPLRTPLRTVLMREHSTERSLALAKGSGPIETLLPLWAANRSMFTSAFGRKGSQISHEDETRNDESLCGSPAVMAKTSPSR